MMYGVMWRLQAISILKQRLVICVCWLRNGNNYINHVQFNKNYGECVWPWNNLFSCIICRAWPWKLAGLERSQSSVLDFAAALVHEFDIMINARFNVMIRWWFFHQKKKTESTWIDLLNHCASNGPVNIWRL